MFRFAQLRRWNNNVVGYLILFLGLLGAFYFTDRTTDQSRSAIVNSGRVVVVDGCNRDFKVISSIRGLLIAALAAQEVAHKAGRITDAQRKQGQSFYKNQLSLIQLPDCRNAQKVLTQNPDKFIPVPVPLHP